ncbi:uncharacterized protein A1O5_13266 [Cladophialophora psammophila CBS 110553]|uniref:Amino acid permease/ SLC12A domain-containing protein n=1 Tax=Cladophialophora psammophila CBS 110553 TaxID=1182543 RepID=W9VKE0_9EURO|nr:uncharacterized protein A1O5_13266 [Cladophialophora psammophila CBS 110553]EXJ53490.1 hypothetical protein A1O5_13266 [Cladophialophora psammophila CBS 110553]
MEDQISQKQTHHSETQVSEGIGEVAPKVHFKLWSALGYQYCAQVTPLVVGTYLSLTIGLGGSAGYFWCFVFVGIFQLIFCLAAAEMASGIPHSSGPAHWVIVLGPPKWSHVIGYILGWVTNCGWMCVCAASSLYLAQLTMALIVASYPDFDLQPWHTYLVYIGYSLLELFLNLPIMFKVLNLLLSTNIVLINLTSVFLLIVLLAKAGPKQSAYEVFVHFVNESGWSSDGVVFFLGVLPGLVALGAFDNASHLTDEVSNPSKQIPQVLLGSTVMGFLTGVPMIMVYEFCNVDPESLLEPVGGQPIVQLILNATNSLPLTIVGTVAIMFCFFIAGCSYWISWSRLYWSFSREGALPFGKYMSKLSGDQSLPINALFLVTSVTIALGSIQLGSAIAMNALLGGAALCTVSAFAACFAFVTAARRHTIPIDGSTSDALAHRVALFLYCGSFLFWSGFLCHCISQSLQKA